MFFVFVRNLSMSESSLLIDPVSKEYDLVGLNAHRKVQRERLVDLDTLYGIIGLNDPDCVLGCIPRIKSRVWITKQR